MLPQFHPEETLAALQRERVTFLLAVPTIEPAPDPLVITQYCRRQLASYKCPERIFFRADLPRNASGKVLRHELQAELTAPSKENDRG